MKRFFALFLALVAFLALGNGKVFAKDKPAAADTTTAESTSADDTGVDEDQPTAISVSDLEILSNKIADLAKSAKVSLLLQTQYYNTGFNPLLPKGFSSPTKVSAETGAPYNDLFLGKRAEISFTGDLADKKIAYKVQYDPLATTTAKPGVSNGEQLKDYWIKASYIPFATCSSGNSSTRRLWKAARLRASWISPTRLSSPRPWNRAAIKLSRCRAARFPWVR